ncbi:MULTISPECIES: winged helix-turn-helix domain-containing protein [Sutcliffiella]|uniref:OmpR/PhoB-type domain-containing protein n=1 Tax=Sutcliffiella cohnii TaxID=33932 RepID=A0A223KKS5_9BACI|nr:MULTISPECIES: winged helix-turn-helix domain-containing protein [Sutcliffiella]AST89974.1 hypothetical protein BC6307_01100 [Sutcliffiella cohnii]WBL15598.1 winged helix-turn-helix domain-containing protein [Sutcliffiella sp. NC1]
MSISFNLNEYSITIEGTTLKLLRKEFLLLDFLYQNKNQTLTRDQLLQAVWPLQVPSDRTVDDHIYRLRKKLKKWDNVVTIETVKGLGYKLVLYVPFHESHEIAHDMEFQSLTKNLISKYHLYGHGQAIQQLIDGSTFGIQLDDKHRLLVNFLQGDFLSILHSAELTNKEKALPLFGLYLLLEKDTKLVDYYLTNLELKQYFGEDDKEEIDLIRILFELRKGNNDLAKSLLIQADSNISPKLVGFYGFFQINWLTYAISIKDWDLAEQKIDVLSSFFEQHPFQREYGLFLTLKGIYHFYVKRKVIAVNYFTQAFTVLKKTKFAFPTIHALYIADILRVKDISEEASEMLAMKTEEVYEQYELPLLTIKIKKFLDSIL